MMNIRNELLTAWMLYTKEEADMNKMKTQYSGCDISNKFGVSGPTGSLRLESINEDDLSRKGYGRRRKRK